MSLKQAMFATVGELGVGSSDTKLAKANFENAIWTLEIKNSERVFTTTQSLKGTIYKNIPVTGTCIFTLTERVTNVGIKYSLKVSLTFNKKDSFQETVSGRLSTDVLQLVPITVDTYKIKLIPRSLGPGNGFTSTFLSNFGYTVRLEFEQELSLWVLFIDKGVSLVPID